MDITAEGYLQLSDGIHRSSLGFESMEGEPLANRGEPVCGNLCCACTLMCRGVHLSQQSILMSSAAELVLSASTTHSLSIVSRLSIGQVRN